MSHPLDYLMYKKASAKKRTIEALVGGAVGGIAGYSNTRRVTSKNPYPTSHEERAGTTLGIMMGAAGVHGAGSLIRAIKANKAIANSQVVKDLLSRESTARTAVETAGARAKARRDVGFLESAARDTIHQRSHWTPQTPTYQDLQRHLRELGDQQRILQPHLRKLRGLDRRVGAPRTRRAVDSVDSRLKDIKTDIRHFNRTRDDIQQEVRTHKVNWQNQQNKLDSAHQAARDRLHEIIGTPGFPARAGRPALPPQGGRPGKPATPPTAAVPATPGLLGTAKADIKKDIYGKWMGLF